ncbi:hypothetical protein HEP89_04240 [Labrenzia sp. 5N]|uniref:hypothetical protein n=1 Tax=Labrenzia sp. 5N TaxID=2723402 RepID=UPI001448609F|nr:hypothetical protein [Labrenzia sp. 5N]NKX63298.1 hypothetical protein [Labrenzia sp. 5N]
MNAILKVAVISACMAAPLSAKADIYAIVATDHHGEGTEKLGGTLAKLAGAVLTPNDRVIVLDGTARERIADIAIPSENRFNSAKFRFNYLKKNFRPIATYQAKRETASSVSDANDLLSFYRYFGDTIRAAYPGETVHMIVFGSAVQHDPRQQGFSMRGAVYPNDGHFTVDGFTSPYGVADRANHYRDVKLHFCFADNNLQSLEYEEHVERAWSLYIAGLGGTLATFTRDTKTCIQRFLDKSDPQREFLLNPEEKEPVMIRLLEAKHSRKDDDHPRATAAQPQKRLAANQGGRFLGADIPVNAASALNTRGRLKVGVRWDCACDLDLYVRHKSEEKPLYYANKRSKLGSFFKDWTSSTKDALSYEFIEFNQPVDARELEIRVNFHSGKVPGGPKGAVRIWLEGQDGVWEQDFHMRAERGNRGNSSTRSGHWITIDPLAVLNRQGT